VSETTVTPEKFDADWMEDWLYAIICSENAHILAGKSDTPDRRTAAFSAHITAKDAIRAALAAAHQRGREEERASGTLYVTAAEYDAASHCFGAWSALHPRAEAMAGLVKRMAVQP
jgi:hypothetical protein